MSEQYIYVSCRCFLDGVTSQVPLPRSDLRLDTFGNLVPASGGDAEDFPEDVYDWMVNRACAHHRMREVEAIFHPDLEYPPMWLRDRREPPNLHLVRELDSGRYPDLTRLLDRFPHAHGVILWPEHGPGILAELDRLSATTLPGHTRVLIDERGDRLWPTIDPEGFNGRDAFTSVYGNRRPDSDREDLLEVGVRGNDVVVRSSTSGHELLRGQAVEQFVDRGETVLVGRHYFPRIRFRDLASGTVLAGFGEGVGHLSFSNFHQPVLAYARTLRITQIPLVIADTAYFPHPLRAALEACISTGNPIVTYHSSGSLGFDGADRVRRTE